MSSAFRCEVAAAWSRYRQAGHSIHQPLRQPGVGIDPSVAQERPVRARDIHFGQVNRLEQALLFAHAGFGEDLAGGSGDKALTPELYPITPRGPLETNAVRHRDVATIGNRVAALNQFPRFVLVGSVTFLFTR